MAKLETHGGAVGRLPDYHSAVIARRGFRAVAISFLAGSNPSAHITARTIDGRTIAQWDYSAHELELRIFPQRERWGTGLGPG